MSTESGENPKDRLGALKPPLTLVPPAAIIVGSKVMGLGAKKYGPYNWRQKKVRYTVYLEAAMRHILSALDGEELDPESGQPHVGHAFACMAILLDAKATGNLVDDRPTPGVAGKLIAELTEKAPQEAALRQLIEKVAELSGTTPPPAPRKTLGEMVGIGTLRCLKPDCTITIPHGHTAFPDPRQESYPTNVPVRERYAGQLDERPDCTICGRPCGDDHTAMG